MSSRTAVLGTRGGYGSLWAVHTEAERAAYLACRFSVERFGKYEILRELGRGGYGSRLSSNQLFTWMVSRVIGKLKFHMDDYRVYQDFGYTIVGSWRDV
jgi:hypothetical protein